jgi:hypothetical protein
LGQWKKSSLSISTLLVTQETIRNLQPIWKSWPQFIVSIQKKNIKGKPKEVLRVFQTEGIQIPESENKNSNTIQVSDGYLPLTAGGRYLFFLQSTMRFPDAPYPDLYHGVAEPWRFRVEDGQALPETAWELSAKYFPPTELNHLVEDIELEALGN